MKTSKFVLTSKSFKFVLYWFCLAKKWLHVSSSGHKTATSNFTIRSHWNLAVLYSHLDNTFTSVSTNVIKITCFSLKTSNNLMSINFNGNNASFLQTVKYYTVNILLPPLTNLLFDKTRSHRRFMRRNFRRVSDKWQSMIRTMNLATSSIHSV